MNAHQYYFLTLVCTVDLEIYVLTNFHVINYLCIKIFVGTTPYHVKFGNVH